MGTKGKILIGIGVVAVVGVAVVMNLRGSRIPTTEVEVEEVRARRLVSIVEASGQIEPSISVDISSDVIGRITDIGPEEGDRVDKGQFLVQVDPTQLQQRVVQFEAAVDTASARQGQAEANLEQAELEHRRKKSLWDQQLTPEAEFDAARVGLNVARSNLRAAEFAVHQSRASLEEARDSLSKCRMVAPMSGIVIRKNAEVGETAISGTLNNAGSLLMTIADLSSMETEVEVDETDVVNIRLGQEAAIELDAFPDREFAGTVTEIANSSVLGASQVGQPQQSANYRVTVRLLEMPETIRPGLSATARITTAVREDALAVPIQALAIREVKEDEEPEEAATEDAVTEADATEAAATETAATETAEAQEPDPGVALADTSSQQPDGQEVPAPEEPAAEETAAPETVAELGDEEPAAEEEEGDDDPSEREKEGVFVVRDGVVAFVPVEVGIAGEKHFEVTGDLEAGDQVVSGPFSAIRSLKDGDAVKIKGEEKEEGTDEPSDSA